MGVRTACSANVVGVFQIGLLGDGGGGELQPGALLDAVTAAAARTGPGGS
jgi:hypothetical protein